MGSGENAYFILCDTKNLKGTFIYPADISGFRLNKPSPILNQFPFSITVF